MTFSLKQEILGHIEQNCMSIMETVTTLVAVTLVLNGFVEVNVDAFRHFQVSLMGG